MIDEHKKNGLLYANIYGKESLYTPIQLHFHSPSEHTIDGQHATLELHIVHLDVYTRMPKAVIAVLFNATAGPD